MTSLTALTTDIGARFDNLLQPTDNVEQIVFWVQQQLFIENCKSVLMQNRLKAEVLRKNSGDLEETIEAFIVATEHLIVMPELNQSALLLADTNNVSECFISAEAILPPPDQLHIKNIQSAKTSLLNYINEQKRCANQLRSLRIIWETYEQMVQQTRINQSKIIDEMRSICKRFESLRNLDATVRDGRSEGSTQHDYNRIFNQTSRFLHVNNTKTELAKTMLPLAKSDYPSRIQVPGSYNDKVVN